MVFDIESPVENGFVEIGDAAVTLFFADEVAALVLYDFVEITVKTPFGGIETGDGIFLEDHQHGLLTDIVAVALKIEKFGDPGNEIAVPGEKFVIGDLFAVAEAVQQSSAGWRRRIIH